MTMRRLLLAVSLLAFSLPAAAAQTFKIATLAPDGSSWMNDMRAAAEEIGKRTDNRVQFRFYPGGVMGNDQSVLRKIRIGQLHGAAFTAGSLAEVYPDINVLGLPFLFRNLDEVDYLRSQLDPVLRKGLEDAGFVNFGFAEGGFAKVMSTRPIRKTTDLNNEKAWVPDNDKISYRVMSALGVSPVRMPITDVLTGLQTGLISVVGSSPLGAIAFQWHTRIKYMTDEPLIYLVGLFVIDKRAFDKLSEADRKVVREVMEATYARLDKANREDNARAHQALQQQGVEFVKAEPDAIRQWRATAERVNRELAKEGMFSEEITDRAYRLLEEYRSGKAAQ
ncbi:MAG TPA: TRAP transporter substrate-binding protein DctP [Gammaproteobacteria bacterium]|nr:TRAP transporter substrate-binding protein DctP [Gammaproteobacteria bacterium]